LAKLKVQFRLRVSQGDDDPIGPGKVALLEAIQATGSIAAGARSLNMSYRRAWLLIDATNQALLQPAVTTSTQGAALTATGEQLIKLYRQIEITAHTAAAAEISALSKLVARKKSR
jgi:molybdate transport system regulatory protein